MDENTIDTELLIQACSCNKPDCDQFVVAIRRPQIKPIAEDPNELVAVAYVPKEAIPAIIERLVGFSVRRPTG